MNDCTENLQAEYDSLVPPPLAHSRRGFLVTALGAGFALAARPVMAETAISTAADGLLAGEIGVATADGVMPAYRAQPATGSDFPVILVVQEIFGVHEHIKDLCRRLAKLGYQAIAPELYARQGDPRAYTEIPDLIAKLVNRVPDAQVMSDLDACVAWAKDNGGEKITIRVAIDTRGKAGIQAVLFDGREVYRETLF
jgi:carboxymethylenebutenolidase